MTSLDGSQSLLVQLKGSSLLGLPGIRIKKKESTIRRRVGTGQPGDGHSIQQLIERNAYAYPRHERESKSEWGRRSCVSKQSRQRFPAIYHPAIFAPHPIFGAHQGPVLPLTVSESPQPDSMVFTHVYFHFKQQWLLRRITRTSDFRSSIYPHNPSDSFLFSLLSHFILLQLFGASHVLSFLSFTHIYIVRVSIVKISSLVISIIIVNRAHTSNKFHYSRLIANSGK